jgi:hypothetical protein
VIAHGYKDQVVVATSEDILGHNDQGVADFKRALSSSADLTSSIKQISADGRSRQVMVIDSADLFDVTKVQSTCNLAQLVGSMSKEILERLIDVHYSS